AQAATGEPANSANVMTRRMRSAGTSWGQYHGRKPNGDWTAAELHELLLLRTAIREYWPVHPDTAAQIVEDLDRLSQHENVRFLISVRKTFLAITRASMEAERVLAKLSAEGHPEAAGAVRARPSQSGGGF